ncbi:uncharacterized protein [Blastocystis hominis]|uniref:Uncharacterized protein n=1 Tax=Blastocystis hominis TaxID=12968 RepID=D8M8S3_BLAHO|nr:uncharacterized protein [Blastocystis hominis]CBK24462.2 unnamed protein product [Blastocystis hominis]|eukprot:XP_012898510.1 uncharacterized protein [Blastocystis hominis]
MELQDGAIFSTCNTMIYNHTFWYASYRYSLLNIRNHMLLL